MKPHVILIVEDNPVIRKFVRLTLGNEGFTVFEAGDGTRALQLAAEKTPDLILQDLLLPDFDGFELVARLRAMPELLGVPIIAFSGFLSRLEHGRAAAAGFTDFLPKPVEPSRLIQVVRAHLPSEIRPEQIGDSRHILIVDDDPVQLKLARIRFEGLGMDVKTATDGIEALEVLQRGGIEGVVSDVLMPRLDGFGLCAAIRADPRWSTLPVVLVSSNYVEEADRQLARNMGATTLLVRTPDLADAIRALREAPSAAPSASTNSDSTEHHQRVLRQLERQAALNAAFAHRSAMHASMLSVVAGMSEALTRGQAIEDSARDVLSSLLEASGVSMGALFTDEPRAGTSGVLGDGFDMKAQAGFPTDASGSAGTFWGHPEILEDAIAAKRPSVIGSAVADAAGRELLARTTAKSALLIPCVADEKCLAVLFLASRGRDLTDSDWMPFARTIAVQLGQAFALSRAFGRLASSENRNRLLLEGASDGIAIFDRQGNYVDVNLAMERFLGRSRTELIGQPIGAAVIGDERAGSAERLSRLFEKGSAPATVRRFVRPDGSVVVGDISATVLEIDEGLVLAIVRDVTERERADAEVRLLQRLSGKVGAAPDLLSAFKVVLEDICNVSHWSIGAAWMPQPQRNRMECVCAWIRDDAERGRLGALGEGTFVPGEGLLGRTWSTRQPHWAPDLATEPNCPRSELAASLGIHAALAVPMIVGDEVIAVFEFLVDQARVEDKRLMALVSVAAEQLSADFARKRAESALRRRAQISALSASVGVALSQAESLPGMLQGCAEALVTHLDAAFARIWTLNEQQSVLELRASAGLYTHLDGPHGRVPVGEFKIGRIAANRQPHLTNDVVNDPEVGDRDWAKREGMVAFAGHPLIANDRVIGVMALFARHALADTVLEALGSIADHIALGMDRVRKTEALRISQGRFDRLAESGIVGIMIADLAGNISEANDAYLRMIGYSREELVEGGIRWADLTPPEFRDVTDAAVAQLKERGVATAFEIETLRKDGSRLPVLIGVAMLDYPNCIAFSADLSERKKAEAALAGAESQLRQAQKMEAVGRLAGGVAHDFNNLLSVILGFGELVLGELKAGDPLRKDVEEVCKAGHRAADLTRQLLMFSRQQVLEPRVLDLNEVLTGMDRMLGRILGEDVELTSLPCPSLGRVKLDPSSLEQIIMNLVVNARDAMPTGGKLTIETANVDLDESYAENHLDTRPGPYVALFVTDTGIGMSRETQARMFEPFFTTKEMGKGTGLGLSTVFGIVQQSGGTIWAYSEPGHGTTFKIYLPRVDGELDATGLDAAPVTLRGTETILLVEDEDQVRAVAVSMLRRQGYRVLAAQNGGEALLLCEKHSGPIDLLLTDVVMPQMSGPELAKRLEPLRPEMRLLCMSGYTDDSIVRHGVLSRNIAFLQKPITSTSLGRKVREVLDGRS